MSDLKIYAMPDGGKYQLDDEAAEALKAKGVKLKEVRFTVKSAPAVPPEVPPEDAPKEPVSPDDSKEEAK